MRSNHHGMLRVSSKGVRGMHPGSAGYVEVHSALGACLTDIDIVETGCSLRDFKFLLFLLTKCPATMTLIVKSFFQRRPGLEPLNAGVAQSRTICPRR